MAPTRGDVVAMEGGVGGIFTVRLSCTELEPLAFVAVAVKAKVPPAVGVPLMIPVPGPNESPAGSVPLVIAQVIGAVPVATKV